MGTHPIFESDFDCLTEKRLLMTDAGYYRGTAADQDTRFQDKQKKLLKTLKFSDALTEPVDMRKVKLDALKPWIHEKLTEILGFEDDVVIDYAINQLEETNTPDPKIVQINLTGFLNAKNARLFMAELWPMLVSAMQNKNGIPEKLIEMKKQEMEQNRADKETMQKFQKNIDQIQESIKKEIEEKGDREKDRRRSRDRDDRKDDRKKKDRRRSRSREKKREKESRKKRSRSKERKRERSRSREKRREKRRERSRSREKKREKRRSTERRLPEPVPESSAK